MKEKTLMNTKETVTEVTNRKGTEFCKEEAKLCKGIAIILMLFHHLFYKMDNYSGFKELNYICLFDYLFISP